MIEGNVERVQADLESLYFRSKFIRSFEILLLDLFSKGRLSGTTHTSIGQEGNAVGVAAACGENDIFVSNHRCHAHLLSHVFNPELLLWEIMGDDRGFCGGIGGSQHICIPGRFYSNGIQGGIVPLAAGLAYSIKFHKEPTVVCVFIGDGTSGEGALYEALNLISIHKLPVLIVVEDNGIAQTTSTLRTISGSLSGRFEAFDIRVDHLVYPSADEVYRCANSAIKDVRDGKPRAIIIKSTRIGPHSKGDDTRTQELIQENIARDPLLRLEQKLEGACADSVNLNIDIEIQKLAKLADLELSGGKCPAPEYLPFLFDVDDFLELDGSPFSERINHALKELLRSDDAYILMGEDIGDPYGGAFKVTKGLQNEFSGRVVEMPISELGFVGLAAGAALSGVRPIVEIMFGDFVILALDQLINHAAKYRMMYNNQVICPLLIRLPMGGGRGYGPTHSQSLEKHICGVPGLQVIAISPYLPVKSIYKQFKGQKTPLVIIENKIDYTKKISLAKDLVNFDYKLFGNIVEYSFRGSERPRLRIVCYGGAIALAIDVANELMLEHELDVAVVCITQLFPMDMSEYLNNAGDFDLVVSIEEGVGGWSFSSEVCRQLAGIYKSKAPKFCEISARDAVIPTSRGMEGMVLPTKERVVERFLIALNDIESEKLANE